VAGCATPTGSAGHAGATANLKLTFHLDHSAGADQVAARTILAKRIIEMADQGLKEVPELRDDALAFLRHNRPFRLIAKGSAENYRSDGSLTRRTRGKAVETV